jgi:hypothetical protein
LRLGKILAEVVGGACLDGLFILDHGLDGEGHLRTREALVLGFFTGDDGDGEVLAEEFLILAVDELGLDEGLRLRLVSGVAFLPEELGGAEK